MKIIIAPDSFKDSLSAQGVADAIAQGLAEVWPDAQSVSYTHLTLPTSDLV